MSVNEKMTAIADMIRSYTGKTDKLSLDDMFVGIGEVHANGWQVGFNLGSASDCLPYAKTAQFDNLNKFERLPIDEKTGYKTLILNVQSMKSFASLCYQNVEPNKNVEHIIINGSYDGIITTMNQSFYVIGSALSEATLKKITLNCSLSGCSNFARAFANCEALQEIAGAEIDFSKVSSASNVTGFALGCSSLRKFRVVPESLKYNLNIPDSPLLSSETVESLIAGLAQPSSTRTLTIHDDVKITQALRTTASGKNWNISGGTTVSEEVFDANRE